MDVKDRVKWVYSSKNNQELAERYNQWAKDYDRDLENDFGWIGPQYATEFTSIYKIFHFNYTSNPNALIKENINRREKKPS